MNAGYAPTHNLGATLVARSSRHLSFFRGPGVWFPLIAFTALLGDYAFLHASIRRQNQKLPREHVG
jgi:hypothetical protein